MPLLCGVDFSDSSAIAIHVAASIAALTAQPLHLVHAADPAPGASGSDARVEFLLESLTRTAHELKRFGVLSRAHVEVGLPDQVLCDAAQRLSASLIVVGAIGHRRGRASRLGSHADRLAQHAAVPVLVARDATPFEAWARSQGDLRVVFGVDRSASAEKAGRMLAELVRHGGCQVTAAYLYWPPAEWRRLGLSGVRPLLDSDPQVTLSIEQSLRPATDELAKHSRFRLRAEPHLGSLSAGLVDVAREEAAHLLVVGSHPRNAVRRAWEGSVSRGVLDGAPISVLCVPSPALPTPTRSERPRSVVVATDFSEAGDAAVRLAYAWIADGGVVHLVHVTERDSRDSLAPHDVFQSSPSDSPIRERLFALVPPDAAGRVTSEPHVLKSNDVAEAICQAAERLEAGLVCLGTRSRPRLTRALLGSVAEGVLAATHRPLLLVPPALP